ncbi:hypothetical protein ABIE78_002936 [Sinorhizobium fredii]|uniref:Uncharacterized protein n=1 Tax=Sinorhizobium fredii (strain USDA 257) TaxID=1185652 RepID=I3X5U9_SINF2|nr:hypothetical protein [Sinorhizobium fredii]AFL51255.1 hypothetical protein USDA257_c26810 [Sinorhizobium fredii USDA 257]
MEWRSARGSEDRLRQEAALKDIHDAQVPRAELDRVWEGYDQRFSDHQRQIDAVKQAQGSVYRQRGIILDQHPLSCNASKRAFKSLSPEKRTTWSAGQDTAS